MAIRKLKFVQVKAKANNYKEMLIKAYSCENFHVEFATSIIDKSRGDNVLKEDSFYLDSMNELRHLSAGAGCGINLLDKIEKIPDDEIRQFLAELSEQFKAVSEINETTKLEDDDEEALAELIEIGLEKIHDCQYLKFGLGRLSNDAYNKLYMHDTDQFSVVELKSDGKTHWVCYITSDNYYKEVKKIFDSLFFEEIKIPPFDVNNVICFYNDKINQIYTYCNYRHELLRLYKYVAVIEDHYVVSGFIPVDIIEDFKKIFNGLDVEIDIQNTTEITDITPPTLLKNNWFVKPFEMFVNMYSIPAYRDFDPTTFVCITYCFLFGIMFSDFGQGLILAVGGAILYKLKPKMALAGIVARIGLFSMVFGFLFGSFFGFENVFTPIQEFLFKTNGKLISVMDGNMTMTLLLISVAIGSFLIITTMLINLYLKFKHKEWGEFIFSKNGIAGFALYGYVIVAVIENFVFGNNIITLPYLIPFVYLPLLCFLFEKQMILIFEGQSLKPKNGWGNYVLESIFEVFEVMLGFVTNSMSYLRVTGFVLSHAGMMMVVMTLGEMMANASWLVIILGNVFVMCLEGLIVGIQALRLEYYEMFSRYYTGGGRKFKAITSEI